MKSESIFKTLHLAALAGLAMAGTASAENLNYATGWASGAPLAIAAENWAAKVAKASGGDLTVTVFPLSLLNHAETSAGLRDGIADVGNLTVAYDPGRYPMMELMSDLTFTLAPQQRGNDSLAYVGAISEYILLNCESCRAEFEAQNQIFLGSVASAPHDILCAEAPIVARDDFAGRTIRVGTETYSRFVGNFGGAPTRISINEIVGAFSQGVVDCAVLGAGEILSNRMEEVIKSVTLGVPGGSYSGITSANFNTTAWRRLSAEHRAILANSAADLSAEMSWRYLNARTIGIEDARARGITVVDADPALAAEVATYRADQLAYYVEFYAKKYNITNVEAIADELGTLMAKWVPLVKGVTDAETLAEIYRAEIYNKIDAATYGLAVN